MYLGKVENGQIVKAELPKITCQCIRVPVLNGHTAAVFINFEKKPTKEQLIEKLVAFKGFPQEAELPSAPKQFIQYLEEDNRPQVTDGCELRAWNGRIYRTSERRYNVRLQVYRTVP